MTLNASDAAGMGATILSCSEAQLWPQALHLLMKSWPPSSHSLAALLTATSLEVQEQLLKLLPVATVDGVAPPAHLRPLLGPTSFPTPPSSGLYRHSKELRLLRSVLGARGLKGVLEAIESYGSGKRRWLKVAGSQKAEAHSF